MITREDIELVRDADRIESCAKYIVDLIEDSFQDKDSWNLVVRLAEEKLKQRSLEANKQ